MRSHHRYYDFTMEGRNVGYFEIKQDESQIYMNAKFKMANDIYENPFWLKLDGGKILAFKSGGNEWVDMAKYPENHYPTSAYPLLIMEVRTELEFYAIEDGSGEILGLTTLKRVGNEIREVRDGKMVRKFLMDKDVPIEIDWNGPVSHLKRSKSGAVAGSPFENEEND